MLMLWHVVAVFGAMSGGAALLLHLRPTMTRDDVRGAVRTELERHVERIRALRSVPKRSGSDSAA